VVTLKTFVFNPFQENTYLLFDETRQCVIIDAGCYSDIEYSDLFNYIIAEKLKPVGLINTHGHIDHVLGIAEVASRFGLTPFIHPEEKYLIEIAPEQGLMFGFSLNSLPSEWIYIKDEEVFSFGNSSLKALHVPGHSKGSIALYCKSDNFVITGDVLFENSIGRTDLFGGDYNTLIRSIEKKLMVLPDDTKVFPGHGISTTIGNERYNNPFLNGQ
jgi:glyoxylase-like metal-dependent hydrolase (beta-lactamase superfamily II)